jgi:L-threonylcarbamoyladenylate synthase
MTGNKQRVTVVNKVMTQSAFLDGEVLAYPTEAVYGLGCDPDNQQAVYRILTLKQRSVDKGLILVTHDYQQVQPYINVQAIPDKTRQQMDAVWPGPVTFLLPKSDQAPYWITGYSEMIAIRVSAHNTSKQLCEWVNKPLVSTSANLAGKPPALSEADIKNAFGDQVMLIQGDLGAQRSPSKIINGMTGETIRNG